MASPIITLTTDFGPSSPYVAAMKGVILSMNPSAMLVDITHSIPHQDIRQGALVLAETTHWFPPNSLHVAVVDPGVGTERQIVYARIGPHGFLAPNNGVLSRLAHFTPPTTIIALTESEFWLPKVSNTFHGRDILAPVAARLSMGLEPERLGPKLDRLVMLPWAEVVVSGRKISGRVQSIDSFGNLISDINEAALADVPRGEGTTVTCDEHQTQGIFRAYADQPEMTLIALVGSSGQLELAIVGDSAAIMLGVKVGTPVTVTW